MAVDRASREWLVEARPTVFDEVITVVDDILRHDLVQRLYAVVTEGCELGRLHHAVPPVLLCGPHGLLVLGGKKQDVRHRARWVVLSCLGFLGADSGVSSTCVIVTKSGVEGLCKIEKRLSLSIISSLELWWCVM